MISRGTRQRLVLYLLVVPVTLYVALVATLFVRQSEMVFVPDTRIAEAAQTGIAGLQTVELHTTDGLTLRSWYLPPPDDVSPVILFLHGNGGNVGGVTDHLRSFAAQGAGSLFPEYRGYGGNEGSPTESGLFLDVAAARQFLINHAIKPERTVLYGASLGTGVAIESAASQPCAVVVLEAPYTSLVAVASWRFPIVPVSWLMKDRFDSLSRIGEVHVPVMVLQGSLDGVVPPAEGQALYAAANQPKLFWVSADAGHGDLLGHGSVEAAMAFIHQYVHG